MRTERNTINTSIAACLLVATVQADAQTTTEGVQIYGNLDVGVTYISNTGGQSRWFEDSGISRPSRFGFRGAEDLGGGVQAVFTLESGVGADTGTAGDASAFFNRESSIGLASRTFGTVRLGRMPDFFFADIGIIDSTPLLQGGLTAGYIGFARAAGQAGPPPAVGLHYPGARYNNSIKWLKDFGPVRAGLMYSLGSENRLDKMYSAMLRYEDGGFAIGAAYTKDNFTTAVNARETFAIKAQYRSGPFFYFANYGIGKDTRTSAEIRPLEVGVQYAPTSAWRIGGGIGYAWAINDANQKARIQQPFVGVKYLLSKRTELYGIAAFNSTSDRAVIPSTVGAPGGAPAISTTDSMNALRFGVLHYF